MMPNTPAIYTAPNGQEFRCIVLTGRLDPVFHDYLILMLHNDRKVYADPVRLMPINEA